MKLTINRLSKLTEKHYSGVNSVAAPSWLTSVRWTPNLCLAKENGDILAVSFELSPSPSWVILEKEVVPLLNKRKNFSVALCMFENAIEEDPEIEINCKALGIGLLAITLGPNIFPVITTGFDPTRKHLDILKENGYFPNVLLESAKNLEGFLFSKEIDTFVHSMQIIQKNTVDLETKSKALVRKTIDQLLSAHPSFRDNVGQFMRLEHFEKLLRMTSPDSSDHIYHSFRVFLSGCPVIHKFRKEFQAAHEYYSVGCQNLNIEYAWLLTSIFHDVGYPKQGAASFIKTELADDHINIQIKGDEKRWQAESYRKALDLLSSLAINIRCEERPQWDGGVISDENDVELIGDWIKIYDDLDSHAVISAIDFMHEIYEKAKAAGEIKHRQFIVAHAVPAALAILLHDWKLHRFSKQWKIFPIDVGRFPLAALLAYIDTWDDYKRRGSDSNIAITQYRLTEKTVKVHIAWADSELYAKEIPKYEAFKKYFKNEVFRMQIQPEVGITH